MSPAWNLAGAEGGGGGMGSGPPVSGGLATPAGEFISAPPMLDAETQPTSVPPVGAVKFTSNHAPVSSCPTTVPRTPAGYVVSGVAFAPASLRTVVEVFVST
ncbi:MAG: hypothetical protein AAB500_00275 [Patescibacteria group bacterium]